MNQEAGIPRKYAATIGISVDGRRANLSTESVAINVARLEAYKARLILFPRRNGTHKHGDSSKDELTAHKEEGKTVSRSHTALPVLNVAREAAISEIQKSDMEKGEIGAYKKLREARSEARHVGAREKRAKVAAEEAANKK